METINIANLSQGYHQGLMNHAYEKWESNESMANWFNSLSEIEQYAVAAGKFNQQVENGGISQWIFNDYAKIMCGKLINFLYILPENETTNIIKDFINPLFDFGIKYNWGEGEVEYETVECPDCDGSGKVECKSCFGDDEECSICYGEGEVECSDCDGYGTIENEIYIDNMENLTNEIDFDEIDTKYYEINKEFLEICENFFKSFYE